MPTLVTQHYVQLPRYLAHRGTEQLVLQGRESSGSGSESTRTPLRDVNGQGALSATLDKCNWLTISVATQFLRPYDAREQACRYGARDGNLYYGGDSLYCRMRIGV